MNEFNIGEGENIVVRVGCLFLEKFQGARDKRFRLSSTKKHLENRYWKKEDEQIKCVATPSVVKEFGTLLVPYKRLIIVGEMRLHSFVDEAGEIHRSEVLYIKSVREFTK